MTLPGNFIRYPDLTDDNLWYAVRSAISHIFNNEELALFLDPLTKSINRIYVRYDHNNTETNGGWSADRDIIGSYGFITLSGDIINGVNNDSVDGTDYTANLERVLFHELAHGRLTPFVKNDDYDTKFFAEQIAVFSENALYRDQFGGSERVGHMNGALSGKSLSAVDYLDGLDYKSVEVDKAVAKFVFGDSIGSVTKRYFHPTTLQSAATSQQYYNYVDITRTAWSGVIQDDTIPFDAVTLKILNGSIIEAPISTILPTQAAIEALMLLGPTPKMSIPALDVDHALDQTHLRTISAERFADNLKSSFVDAFGPVDYGTHNTPAIFVLNGRDLSNGAVLFGASGYHHDRIDTIQSADDILGGSGDDLLIPGLGNATVLNPNRLNGGAGDDMLIARPGVDILDGGRGLDIVSYAASGHGVTIDLGRRLTYGSDTPVGLAGDALNDVIKSCETIIGTPLDDVFKGDGSGVIFAGGDGNDEFHLYNRDVAIGGPGADTFYLHTNLAAPGRPGVGLVCGIIGLDPLDRIYVDGMLYTGRTRVMEMGQDENGRRPEIVSDTSAYGPVYGEFGWAVREDRLYTGMVFENHMPVKVDPEGRAVLLFLDLRPDPYESLSVYLWDYQKGDAGLAYSYDYYDSLNDSIRTTDGTDLSQPDYLLIVDPSLPLDDIIGPPRENSDPSFDWLMHQSSRLEDRLLHIA